MLTLPGKLLLKAISLVIGASPEKIIKAEEIENYLQFYSRKFPLGFKFNRDALPHYNFYLVKKRSRIIGGFVVHNSLEFNRTLTLAPDEVRNHPAFKSDLAELCMVWSSVKATPLESSAPMLFGMVEAGKLADSIVACASNENVFKMIQPYFTALIFEGHSPALNSPLWIMTTPSAKYYSSFLRQAPLDFIKRAIVKSRFFRRLKKGKRNSGVTDGT